MPALRPFASTIRHRERWPALALVLVALAFVVAQLVVFPIDRGLNWDEVVFVTQTAIGEPAVYMDVHRTRGMPLLAAPAAVWDPPSVVIRLWMTLVGPALLAAGFWPWVRHLRYGAAASALLFGSFWVAFFFMGEIYPNFPVAMALVAAAGFLARWADSDARSDLLAAGAWMAFAALVRPVDAVVGGVVIGVSTSAIRWRRAGAPLVALGLGGLLGLIPWFVEGAVRFGNLPWEMFFSAKARAAGGATVNQLPLFIRNLEGPVRCVGDCKYAFVENPMWYLPPVRSRIMLVAMALLAFRAVIALRGTFAGKALVAPAAGATVLMIFYSYCGCAVNLRYLLPPIALSIVLVGAGLASLATVRPGPLRMMVLALAAVAALAYVPWQLGLASDEMTSALQPRDRARALADILDERAAGRPCAVAVQYSAPQIQYESTCLVAEMYLGERGWLQRDVPQYPDLRQLAQDGYVIFALNKSGLPNDSPVQTWEREDISSDRLGRYILFTLPPGQLPPPAGEAASS